MIRFVGDPRFTEVPVKQMLSRDLAAERAKLIIRTMLLAKWFPRKSASA